MLLLLPLPLTLPWLIRVGASSERNVLETSYELGPTKELGSKLCLIRFLGGREREPRLQALVVVVEVAGDLYSTAWRRRSIPDMVAEFSMVKGSMGIESLGWYLLYSCCIELLIDGKSGEFVDRLSLLVALKKITEK